MKQVIDCQTGETIERELTTEELEQQKADEILFHTIKLATEQAEAEKAAAKEAAEAKLAALGLTADDLKALGLG